MSETTAVKPKKGLFRGWWVIIGALLAYSGIACMYWMTSMIFPLLRAEFGWDAGDLGLLMAATTWLGILWAPIGGWICDRIGNRMTVVVMAIICAGAVLMYTTVTEIWQLFIYWPVIVGFSIQAALIVGIMSLPRKWFMKRAALAAGLLGGFWGVVSSIVFPLVSSVSANIGWRQTIYIMVPIFAALAIFAALFLIKNSPEDIGENVDGMTDEELKNFRAAMGAAGGQEAFMTRGEAMRTPQFWLLALGYGVTMGGTSCIQGNATLMAVTYGIPLAAAGTAMSALMIPAIFSRTGVGPLGDKFGKKRMLMLSSGICAAFLLAGWLFVTNSISLYVLMVALGLVLMAGMTLAPPIYGDLFGRKYLAGIMGLGGGVAIASSGLSVLAFGYISKAFSYNVGFLFLAAVFVLQVVCFFLLRPTKVQIANMGGKGT